MKQQAPDLRRLVRVALRASAERKKVEAELERALDERDVPAVFALARKLLGLPPASVQ